MFDPVSRRDLAAAPSLPGLSSDQLAQAFTSAYVEIASARLMISGSAEGAGGRLRELSDRMARLSNVLEAQVILGVNSERVKSAAFAAASARQVLHQVERLTLARSPTRVDADAISGDLAAALLFLIAERTPDARESAGLILPSEAERGLRGVVASAIRRLARGELTGIAKLRYGRFKPASDDLTAENAADHLYFRVLEGLVLVARDCLGQLTEPGLETAQAIFAQVRSLAVDNLEALVPGTELQIAAPSILPGPHHLASLLQKAAGLFQTAALVRIPCPNGADEAVWSEWLKGQAKQWPFIWENHRRAVETGYLTSGHSLVMASPTGSGKTTLAILKIAAALAAGKTVIYLAPTHALVNQIERDLNDRIGSLAKATSVEEALLEEIGQQLPDVAVLTPERCFALLTFAPEIFAQVGLLVFDECHLLGTTEGADLLGVDHQRVDRRSIDAMLCLLTFMSVRPDADYLLLSAMMSNAPAMAKWLESQTGRPCYPFDDKWKPTRQLRGCVTYDRREMNLLRSALGADWIKRPVRPPSVPAPVKAMAVAKPHGVFSLVEGWNPDAPATFALRPLTGHPVPLGVAKRARGWGLTSNRNEVAAALADSFRRSGLKTIVFCESIVATGAIAKRINALGGSTEVRRDERQERWRASTILEVGAVDAIYDGGTHVAAVHHGELMPEERLLVETMFRKVDGGVDVLAATSTLAQGLNLPCDVVILAGTDRIDVGSADPSRQDLLPHEILNALGRAGRAGLAATGIAIVVPAEPTECDIDAGTITDCPTNLLETVFSAGDQCLPLADPLCTIFDQVAVHGVRREEQAYLLRRLSLSFGADVQGVENFGSLTRRSFGYFQRASQNQVAADAWLAERKDKLERLIHAAREEPKDDWINELAAKSGASPGFIASLAEAYPNAPLNSADAFEWLQWILNSLSPESPDFDNFLRPETLERVFGRALGTDVGSEQRRRTAQAALLGTLEHWFGGKTLLILEASIVSFIVANEGEVSRPTRTDPKAKHARRFALRLAPDLSYLCGVVAQIGKKLAADGAVAALPFVEALPQLVRKGYRTAYHLYLAREEEGSTRPGVERTFRDLQGKIAVDPADDWDAVRAKVERAQFGSLFADLSDDGYEAIADSFQVAVDPSRALGRTVPSDPPPLSLPPPETSEDDDDEADSE